MAEGQMLGHADGLSIMGFGLDFSKSCPTFMQHNSKKLRTNSLPWVHRMGISSIKHCLLGPQAQVWEVLYGRGTMVGAYAQGLPDGFWLGLQH
jgi:hypothetical protein